MTFKVVILWTDGAVFLLLASLVAYGWNVRQRVDLRAIWRKVFADPVAMVCASVLTVFLLVALLDSLHFRMALPARAQVAQAFDTRTLSVLDLLLTPLIASREDSYSAPLAVWGYVKQTPVDQPTARRTFPRLKHGGAHLRDPIQEYSGDIAKRLGMGLSMGLGWSALLWCAVALGRKKNSGLSTPGQALPWQAAVWSGCVILILVSIGVALGSSYHVLGTDRTGNDVLYLTLKSLRTAFVIGGLTQLWTLPFALVLGLMAGYFKGWVDELIQYIYTVVSSVPGILLIAACMLMVQVFLDKNPQRFETGLERADLKLFLLCLILGVTGWAGICRLLRAETLKLRELEYVQAAQALGVGPWRILARHILPNVMHLVIITTVLEFSGMILYEAVLSYVGVGVDASMYSFGVLINQARGEMSREPVVWWSFASAFGFMVTLVLAVNLFADGVREAFDPRSRAYRNPARKPARQPARSSVVQAELKAPDA